MRHDGGVRRQEPVVHGLDGTRRHFRTCHGLEAPLDRRKGIAVHRRGRRVARQRPAASPRGDQADARLDQSDVALQRGDHVVTVHEELAAAPEGHAPGACDHRYRGIAHPGGGLLEAPDHPLQGVEVAGLQRPAHLLEVGANGERGRGLPQHEGVVTSLRGLDGLHHAVEHVPAHRVLRAAEAEHADVTLEMPQPHPRMIQHGLAPGRMRPAQQRRREILAAVDRQAGGRTVIAGPGRPGPGRRVCGLDGEHPVRQGDVRQGPARLAVGVDGLRRLLPAGGLPGLERPLLPGEPPADGEVHIAGIVGDGAQQVGGVMEGVAVDRPQELGLGVFRGAQRTQPRGRVALGEDLAHRRVDLPRSRAIVTLHRIHDLDALAALAVDARAGLAPEGPRLDEPYHPVGQAEVIHPRVILQPWHIALDHVPQGVQAHEVGGAEGRAPGPADRRTGQRVHHVRR